MLRLKITLHKIGHNSRVYYANITEPYNVSMGHHVYINKNCDIITTGSRVQIGNFIMIGPNTTIIAQNHDISDWSKPMILNNKYQTGIIKIEDDVWIGANVTILPGVTIGRGSVIGAGSVVTKSVPIYSVYAGVPAKKIRDRINPKVKETAKRHDLELYKNSIIDWQRWGVGDVIR